jgi:hypothetical protein
MRHLNLITKSNRTLPARAIALLEKQAVAEVIETDLSQIAVFLNIIADLKTQASR